MPGSSPTMPKNASTPLSPLQSRASSMSVSPSPLPRRHRADSSRSRNKRPLSRPSSCRRRRLRRRPVAATAPPPAAVAPAQDPQTVMAEIPQISPVEQFDLRGVFRISPRANSSIALNSEAAGTIFVMNVKPEWDSGQWVFEPVPGLPFVRIKNQWKKTYLTDVGGKLRATSATPDADEAHWTFEPVDGTPFVQFRNRETDRFLIVAGDAPALVDALRPGQEDLSQWKVGPTGRAAAAAPPPPPRNSAYDAALANCRELGGYWTGSSCRASIASQPLGVSARLCMVGRRRRMPVGWRQLPALAGRPRRPVHERSLLPWRCRADVAPRLPGLLLPAWLCCMGRLSAAVLRPIGRPHRAAADRRRRDRDSRRQSGAPADWRGLRQQEVLRSRQDRHAAELCGGHELYAAAGRHPAELSPPGAAAGQQSGTSLLRRRRRSPVVEVAVRRRSTSPSAVWGRRCRTASASNLNAAITCTGGKVEQGVCGCPQGTRLTGGGTNFQCVATGAQNPGGTPVVPPTTCGPNRVGTPPACQCAPGRSGPNCAPDAPCDPRTQTGTPGQCVDKVIPCEGGIVDRSSGTCTCGSGKGAVNGVCVAKTCSGGQMVGDQCRCSNPNQTAQRTSFTTFVCAGTGATACPSDSTGTPPSCICKTGTTGQPGSCKPAGTIAPQGGGGGTNPIVQPASCGANRVGTPPDCQCAPGRSGPACAPDAPCDPRTQTGTPGKCVEKVIPCEGGVVDRGSGTCTCGSGKGAVNGVCVAKTCSGGQMVGDQCRCSNPNQTAQRTSFTTFVCVGSGAGACPSDSTGTPPSCTCKTGTTGQPGACKPAGTGTPGAPTGAYTDATNCLPNGYDGHAAQLRRQSQGRPCSGKVS